MGGGGGAPAIESTPAVKSEDPAVQQAAADAARRRKVGRGYRSTILGSRMIDSNSPAGGGSGQPGSGQTIGS